MAGVLAATARWATAASTVSVEQVTSVKETEGVFFKAPVLLGRACGMIFISCFFRTGMGRMRHCFEGKSLLL